MADLTSDTLETNATQPSRASGGGSFVEQHSLKNQLEVLRYLASQAAVQSDKGGFAIRRFKPTGSVGASID